MSAAMLWLAYGLGFGLFNFGSMAGQMARRCKENREERAEARLSGLTTQIEAICLSLKGSGLFERLQRRKGLKVLTLPAPLLLASVRKSSDH
jgi:hypothetical protein